MLVNQPSPSILQLHAYYLTIFYIEFYPVLPRFFFPCNIGIKIYSPKVLINIRMMLNAHLRVVCHFKTCRNYIPMDIIVHLSDRLSLCLSFYLSASLSLSLFLSLFLCLSASVSLLPFSYLLSHWFSLSIYYTSLYFFYAQNQSINSLNISKSFDTGQFVSFGFKFSERAWHQKYIFYRLNEKLKQKKKELDLLNIYFSA